MKKMKPIETIYTIPKTTQEKERYVNLILNSISNIDEAINTITYRSNLIDIDTKRPINESTINKLNEIIYVLEDYMDKDVLKPYIPDSKNNIKKEN